MDISKIKKVFLTIIFFIIFNSFIFIGLNKSLTVFGLSPKPNQKKNQNKKPNQNQDLFYKQAENKALSATSSYLAVDENTRQILDQKNADSRRSIASLTKLITAYLIEKKLVSRQMSFNQKVKIGSGEAKMSANPETSNIQLKAGQTLNIYQLLDLSLIGSSNSATIALAKTAFGTIDKANSQMEKLLASWGIHTKINSPCGLPNNLMGDFKTKNLPGEAQNKLSARQITLVADKLLNNFPNLRKIFSSKQTRVGDSKVLSGNMLLFFKRAPFKYTGVKTGSDTDAGGNIIGEADISGHKILVTILGSGNYEDNYTRAYAAQGIFRKVAGQLSFINSPLSSLSSNFLKFQLQKRKANFMNPPTSWLNKKEPSKKSLFSCYRQFYLF